MRTIIVGDIHGCARTCRALLERLSYDPADTETRLVFVGDYVDRGPRIRETMDDMIRLRGLAGDRAVFLRGNHEDMMLRIDADTLGGKTYWTNPQKGLLGLVRYYDGGRDWYRNGGKETDRQLVDTSAPEELEKYLGFLRSLALEYRADAFAVTHGGAILGVDEDPDDVKIWNRDYGIYRGPLVICGHTPVGQPVHVLGKDVVRYSYDVSYELPERGHILIDTGCVFGYELTAMVIEGERFWMTGVKNCE